MKKQDYLQEIVLKIFVEIELKLTKPLGTMLSALIVVLLENKEHTFRD